MLRGHIRLQDLGNPASYKGRDLTFGSSRLSPFEHALLEHVFVQKSAGFELLLYEKTLLVEAEKLASWRATGYFVELRNALDEAGSDYLFIQVDGPSKTIRAVAGHIGTAPVYLTLSDQTVWLDWSPNEVIRRSAKKIDLTQAAAFLTARLRFGTQTLFEGVYRVAAGTTIEVVRGKVNYPEMETSRSLNVTSLKDAADPRPLLFHGMRAVFRSRPIEPAKVAAEISGGMDSGIAALAASAAFGPGMHSIGAVFNGAMGIAQQERRRLIISAGEYSDIPIRASDHAPYGPSSTRRLPPGVYPEDENYPELFEHCLDVLAENGIDTLISGQGGDELYPFYVSELGPAPSSDRDMVGPLLTPLTADYARRKVRSSGNQRLLQSCWVSAAGRAERALRHGIWPIYVYHNPHITSFTFRLPIEWRKHRALHSKTLTWLLGDQVFETSYLKETFRPLYEEGIKNNREALVHVFQQSILADYGLINGDAVTRTLSKEDANDADIKSLFFILNLELYLQRLMCSRSSS